MIMSQPSEVVLMIGVDTHAEAHVAVALDQLGRRLGSCTLSTTEAGYADFLRWASQLGTIHTIGMEGTGSASELPADASLLLDRPKWLSGLNQKVSGWTYQGCHGTPAGHDSRRGK